MPESERKLVLCIDDAEIVLHMQQIFLESFGYSVITALGGRLGLQRALSEPIHAAVIDYDMPDLNGAEVAMLVRQSKPGVPIIMYSAHPVLAEAAKGTADAFVEKGSSPAGLVRELRRLLERPVPTISVRRFPRYSVYAHFVVEVYRAGRPVLLHGVALDLGEGGLGGVVEGEVNAGESVSIRLALPQCEATLYPRAQVRYRNGTAHGFEFQDLSATQQIELRRCCSRLAAA